MSGAGSLS